MSERYPVDVDALCKGDVITIERLENILGMKRHDPRWWRSVLGVKTNIERQLRRGGRVLTLRQRQGDLVVCDDNEASSYNPREIEAGIRRSARAHERNLHVDVGNLDDARRVAHERNLVVYGRMLYAAKSARRDLKPTETVRDTPTMLEGRKR